MAALRKEVKLFIVRSLAQFNTPEETAKLVNEEYKNLNVSRQQCERYDPTKRAGKDLSVELKTEFELTRKEFLGKPENIPIAGLNTSSISQQNTVINGINARSTLKLQAGNLVGGVAIENDTKTIDFIIQANKFAIGAPSNTSDTVNPSYAFVYQSTATTLPNGTVIPKGLYLDSAFIGSIDANRINATSLSAISANLGTFTSTATDGSKQVISGALTQGFYANGQMAFRLGIW